MGLGLTYLTLSDDPNLDDREEIIGSASFDITDEWRFRVGGHRDLLDDGRWIRASTGLTYDAECLTLISSVNRRFFRDRDIEPATSYVVQLKLKNLN